MYAPRIAAPRRSAPCGRKLPSNKNILGLRSTGTISDRETLARISHKQIAKAASSWHKNFYEKKLRRDARTALWVQSVTKICSCFIP